MKTTVFQHSLPCAQPYSLPWSHELTQMEARCCGNLCSNGSIWMLWEGYISSHYENARHYSKTENIYWNFPLAQHWESICCFLPLDNIVWGAGPLQTRELSYRSLIGWLCGYSLNSQVSWLVDGGERTAGTPSTSSSKTLRALARHPVLAPLCPMKESCHPVVTPPSLQRLRWKEKGRGSSLPCIYPSSTVNVCKEGSWDDGLMKVQVIIFSTVVIVWNPP